MDLHALVRDALGAVLPLLWSDATFVILLGAGVTFTVWGRMVQIRALTHGVAVVAGRYDDPNDPGAITHFQALSAALSATVGLGNIGGVALAIAIGGPGALFWMWMAGFLGMAIKTVEVTLAMIHRDTSDPANPHGGAMWVARRGIGERLGGRWKTVASWIGGVFCVTLLVSTFTGGNMFQAWNVADITNRYFGVPQVVTGLTLATLTALVILGGIRRIGRVAEAIVPFMCGLYLIAGISVLVVRSASLPELLATVVREAFAPTEAAGAFLGASAWFGLTTGLRRALFSNEAGQGSSPIAHSAARTDEPVREGVVAGLEPFVDTCVVCTLTAMVLLSTGTWNRPPTGDLAGAIAIVERDGSARVVGPTSVEALPRPDAGDAWHAGNGFFLIGERPDDNPDTGNRRIKVTGTVVRGADGALELAWDDPPPGTRLVDRAVYRDFTGAALTAHAFDRAIPGSGKWLVTLTCWLFALSTMISWSYYGEQGVVYLAGPRFVTAYRWVYCAAAVIASLPFLVRTDTDLGDLADLGTGVMLLANMPIVLAMSPVAMRAIRDYFRRMRAERG